MSNRKAALAGLGDPTHPDAYVEIAADGVEANRIFTHATMDEETRKL